ncbi:MAG TPA: phosphatase domain-containing protein [Pyrinomonadaceae bacterium]|nr:phosphatase domain-containing protein [Pyrinomonadaceae bacterium]
MSEWKARIENLIGEIDDFSDKIRGRLRRIKGFEESLIIVPFLGYGNANKFLLSGRVLEDKGEVTSSETDGKRRNLLNLYRRFATDEVPQARVRAVFQGVEREVVTDGEGYFNLELNLSEPLTSESDSPFQEIQLELLEPSTRNGQAVRAVGRVLVPQPRAAFGIISDLDDTVITTNVTNRLKMFLTVALLNEYTRMPFKGVAAFYRALQKGASGAENNPIFYVSSSPWNLYPFLTAFLKLHEIPLGTLFLKDFGNHTIFNSGDHSTHKISSIEAILNTYPDLPFVLIGDSGEKDPEIYREVVRKYPNRIRAIYIRSINTKPERLAAIDKLTAEVAETGCQLVVAPDTEFAAVHAAAEKLISTGELPNIREEKKEAENAPKAQEIVENSPEIQ